MKTVQMTLEPDLVARVDRAARRLKTTRSAFTRLALHEALRRLAVKEQEDRHRRGYAAHPVGRDEVAIWRDEQVWPE